MTIQRGLRAVKLTVACVALAGPSAYALEYRSAAGSTGTIDETGFSLARLNNPALNFKTDAVGTIVARYPITDVFIDPSNTTPKWLGMGYTDSGPNSQVVVKLYEESHLTGVLRLLQTVDSDAFAASTGYRFVWITDCALGLDFSASAYWIEATITRTGATAGVGLPNVRMDNFACGIGGETAGRDTPN